MLPPSGYKTKWDYFCNLKKKALPKRQFLNILAERDLGFSLAKFKVADQCEATEGELNFHKRCTEAREIQISAGNLERNYPKGFRQDIPWTE